MLIKQVMARDNAGKGTHARLSSVLEIVLRCRVDYTMRSSRMLDERV